MRMQDLYPDMRLELATKHFSAEDIIRFARRFDGQPFHIDAEAARNSLFGGLCASGWHTSALTMRMMIDSYILNSTCQGSPGIDLMDWKKPVLAGDTLSGRSVVVSARPLHSRPGIGVVKLRHETENQHGELVALSENSVMFRMATSPEAGA